MFIPLGDDNSGRHLFPIVVYVIVAINIAAWVLQLQGGESFTYAYSTVPFEITHHTDLTKTVIIHAQGHSFPLKHFPGPHPIYLTLLTAMFLHGSWMHIIGNMIYLLIFGDQIEDRLGHFQFLIFYLLCGLAAGFAQIYADPNSVIPCLGASGAIAGVLGAYLFTHPTNRVQVLIGPNILPLPAIIVLGFWIVLQFLGQVSAAAGQGGGIAYMAHIGGFIAAIPLLFFLRRRR